MTSSIGSPRAPPWSAFAFASDHAARAAAIVELRSRTRRKTRSRSRLTLSESAWALCMGDCSAASGASLAARQRTAPSDRMNAMSAKRQTDRFMDPPPQERACRVRRRSTNAHNSAEDRSFATEEASRVEECSERREAAQGLRDLGKPGRNTGELCPEVPGAAASLRHRRQYRREQRLPGVVRVRKASQQIAAYSKASEWTARHDTLDMPGQPRPFREGKRSGQPEPCPQRGSRSARGPMCLLSVVPSRAST